MLFIRGFVKVLIFLVVICIYLTVSFVGQLFLRDPKKRRHFFTAVVQAVCKVGIRFLNTTVIAKCVPEKNKNYLFVSNHLGILDIIVLSSIHPTLFITSVEMRQTPVLGLLCEMAGCLFVERRSRGNIHNEIGEIRGALQQGLCVTLYPEGTSTSGEKVHPFKKSLLTAAAGTDVPILPLVVNYRSVNGEPMSDKWRDHVCWYGDQKFPPTLWRLLTNRSVVAEVEFLEQIHVHSDEQRREVAAFTHAQISAKYAPILKPVISGSES